MYFADFDFDNGEADANGIFHLELCEDFDDAGVSPDGRINSSTIQIAYYGGNPPGEAAFGFSTGSLDFGSVGVGGNSMQSVTVTNYGDAPGNLPPFSLTGAGFMVSGGTCTGGMELDEDESCTVQVTFAPAAAGPASGVLGLGTQSTLRGFATSVSLAGTGVAGGPGPGGVEPVVANVPAGNTWTLGLLAGVLGLVGVGLMRRRG